jgi:hypothetical protein
MPVLTAVMNNVQCRQHAYGIPSSHQHVSEEEEDIELTDSAAEGSVAA